MASSTVLRGPFFGAALTNFFFFASLSCFYLLPLYIRRLGGTEVEIGLIMGMYNASAIFCQPFVGVGVDRFGRRPFMLLGAGLATLSAAVFSVSTSPVVLGFLRLLQGIGYSAFFVANYTFIVDLVPPDRRGWALGIFGISGLLSTALAPLASEWVIRGFGFATFFLLAIALALVALALAWRVREPYEMVLTPSAGLAAIREGLSEVFRLPMALAFTFGLGLGTIFTFLPTFAELLGVRNLALFYTAYAGSAMLVRAVGGGLIDSLGRRRVIVPSLFLQAAGTIILAELALIVDARTPVPVLPFLFLAGFLAGGAHGFLYPALSALLMDQTPEARRGSAVGIFSAVILAGNAAGAMAFGYVAHGLGYGIMWSSLAVVLGLGFAASFRLRPSP